MPRTSCLAAVDIERVRQLRDEYEALLDDAEAARAAYHQALKELHRSGVPLSDLGEKLGMSRQRVHQIVGETTPPSKKRNRRIIGAIGTATLVAVGLVAAVLWRDHSDMTTTRRPPIVLVDVMTKGQSWNFAYPRHGVSVADRSPEIVLPAGTRTRFTLRSADVIHSLWIPQLGAKQDIFPGRTKTFVLHTGAVDKYRGTDAEFAGIKYMLPDFEVRVVTFDEFEEWVAERANEVARRMVDRIPPKPLMPLITRV